MNKWQVSENQIKIIPAYLAEDEFLPLPVKAIASEQVKGYIRQSIEEMRSILVDIKGNKNDINNCPKTDDSWRCQKCKFQEICS